VRKVHSERELVVRKGSTSLASKGKANDGKGIKLWGDRGWVGDMRRMKMLEGSSAQHSSK